MKYYLMFNAGIGFGGLFASVVGVPDTTASFVMCWLALVVSPILAFYWK